MTKAKINGKKLTSNIFVHLFLVILSIIWLIPVVWLVVQSFRGESTGPEIKNFFPTKWTFNNYKALFVLDASRPFAVNFAKWFENTIIVAIFTCIISTLFVVMTSFALSRLRFKGRKMIMNIVLILGMFPGFMSMIAVYFLLKEIFGRPDNLPLVSLIIVYSASSGMGYYICKGFFDTVPKSLDEAAIIDGATRNQIFWKVILPLSKPIIIYTVLTSFLGPWMDFMFVRVLMKGNDKNMNVAYGLWSMLTQERLTTYFTTFCAGAVVVAIPITVLFIIMQKFYVGGITGGADKG